MARAVSMRNDMMIASDGGWRLGCRCDALARLALIRITIHAKTRWYMAFASPSRTLTAVLALTGEVTANRNNGAICVNDTSADRAFRDTLREE